MPQQGITHVMRIEIYFRDEERKPLTIEASGVDCSSGVMKVYDVDGVILHVFPLDTIREMRRVGIADKNLIKPILN